MEKSNVYVILAILLLLGGVVSLGQVGATYGSVVNRDATNEARGILNSNFQNSLVSAEFTGVNEQVLITDHSAAGFPVDGSTYLVLSSGDARYVITGNGSYDVESLGGVNITDGQPVTGANAYDVAMIRIVLRVPYGATKLSFKWRFATDEIPDDDTYQDFFYSYVKFPDGKKVIAATLPNGDIPYVGPIAPYVRGTTPNDGVYLAYITNQTFTATVDVSGYQGKEITVVFEIGDTGDDIVDTAVLIDDLKFNVLYSAYIYNRMMAVAQVWTIYFFRLHDEFEEVYPNATAAGVDNETLTRAMELHNNATQIMMEAWSTNNLNDVKLRVWGAIPTYPKMHLVRRAYVTEKEAIYTLIEAIEKVSGG